MDHSVEVVRLRAAVRDLLALSAIPEAWVGREPPALATELADLLIESLHLDFAFVRLCDPEMRQTVRLSAATLGIHFRNGCSSGSPFRAKFLAMK